MGTGRRSQSFRGPRRSYGKLQEPWGKPVEGQLRWALSLRQDRGRLRSSEEGPERPDSPDQERQPGGLGDTEQLIQVRQGGSWRWLRQYQQQVRRRWESFVASFPAVTLNQPTSSELPLNTTS